MYVLWLHSCHELQLHIYCTTYLDCLEHLEASVYPNIDNRVDGCGHSIKGIGNHQEVVGPNREELPVVRPRCWQQLVNLKGLCWPVPLVYHAVYSVIVITWRLKGGESSSVVVDRRPSDRSFVRGHIITLSVICHSEVGVPVDFEGLPVSCTVGA